MSDADKDANYVLMTAIDAVVGSACIVTLISNVFFNKGLNKLLKAWENLQVVIHMVLINLFCVAAGESFTYRLMDILQFELIDLKPVYSEIFNISENRPVNIHFE